MVPQLHPRTISTPFAYTHNAAVTHHFALNGQFPFIEGPSINIPDSKFHPKWFMKTKVARIYHYAAETNHCCHFCPVLLPSFLIPAQSINRSSLYPHLSTYVSSNRLFSHLLHSISYSMTALLTFSALCVLLCLCTYSPLGLWHLQRFIMTKSAKIPSKCGRERPSERDFGVDELWQDPESRQSRIERFSKGFSVYY